MPGETESPAKAGFFVGGFGDCGRELQGRCAGGRHLDTCPPSPACGGRLLLYCVQTPATHAAARRADSPAAEPLQQTRGGLTRGGRGGCVRSKGGGDGRRPAPGDIRMQLPLPPARQRSCECGLCDRELPGLCAGGRHLDTCPPSPACGGRLLLYCVQTPATHAAARLAEGPAAEPFQQTRGGLALGGRGGCVRSEGGGDGRRPAPGDIRMQPPLPPALDHAAFTPSGQSSTKKRGPRCSGGRARRECDGRGRNQNTKLTPATGPLNSCFRPMVPSLPFLSASSLNQS